MPKKTSNSKQQQPPSSTPKSHLQQKHQQQRQQPPNWPPLRPLIPSTSLTLDPLVPDQIYLIRNFFPSTLCKTYTSFLASLPLTTTPGKPKKGDAVRVNDRFQIQDEGFAEGLWSGTALKEMVLNADEEEEAMTRDMKDIWGGEPIGLNGNIRIYRYSKGQFFDKHCESILSPSSHYPSFLKIHGISGG